MKLAWILNWKIVNVVKFWFYRYPIELNLGWYTFSIWNRLQHTEACVTAKGVAGRVGPTSKVTTPLAYIDDIINDLIQIFMVNKKSCGNLRMCVKCLIVATAALIIVICIHFITNRQYIKSLFITIIQRNKYISDTHHHIFISS